MKLKTIFFFPNPTCHGEDKAMSSFTGISRAKFHMHSSFALEFVMHILNIFLLEA